MNEKNQPRNLLSATDYLLCGATIFGWSTSWIAIDMQLGVRAPEVSGMAIRPCDHVAMGATGQDEHHIPVPSPRTVAIGVNFRSFYYGAINAAVCAPRANGLPASGRCTPHRRATG
jgi:hypothetical protein